ncbi:hypothetical protein ACHHYP_10019 [Achlya hypogyna]|uniref:Poly [ADP-ribose] polymerase n=1 Tax=Achlya hypogyna TaxID=1202772 RepID=A0A1V9ZIG6_ACHHY|nr:hypothetical protein ACHHYP_10019 [Achlya hypogyna]
MKKAAKQRKPPRQTVVVAAAGAKAKYVSRSLLTKSSALHVDPSANLPGTARVYLDDDILYTARLHKVDLGARTNLEVVLQVLCTNAGEHFLLERTTDIEKHYGSEVSLDASSTRCIPSDSLQDAIKMFLALFFTKTGVSWRNRFQHDATGDFTFVDVDPGSYTSQQLSSEVRHLMALLCTSSLRAPTASPFPIPLAMKLSKHTIARAKALLGEMDIVLDMTATRTRQRLSLAILTNRFYALVPHVFGSTMGEHVVDSTQSTATKRDLVATLERYCQGARVPDPLCSHYKALNCDLRILPTDAPDWHLIKTYFDNTKVPLKIGLSLRCVYSVHKEIENKRFAKFAALPNRKLLWHGSSFTNWTSILSKGLLIAPSCAPKNGHSFGVGLYFSDSVSRSVGYCQSNKVGLLVLCEVALGTVYVSSTSDAHAQSHVDGVNFHSVQGIGWYLPESDLDHIMPDGVAVPVGKLKRNAHKSHLHAGGGLEYNEYIIFNTAQMRMRYLVVVDFNS